MPGTGAICVGTESHNYIYVEIGGDINEDVDIPVDTD